MARRSRRKKRYGGDLADYYPFDGSLDDGSSDDKIANQDYTYISLPDPPGTHPLATPARRSTQLDPEIEANIRSRIRPQDIVPLHMWYSANLTVRRNKHKRTTYVIWAVIFAIIARLAYALWPALATPTVLPIALAAFAVLIRMLWKARYQNPARLEAQRREFFKALEIDPDVEIHPIEQVALARGRYDMTAISPDLLTQLELTMPNIRGLLEDTNAINRRYKESQNRSALRNPQGQQLGEREKDPAERNYQVFLASVKSLTKE